MKTFHLQRNEDETGVSGVGTIAEGVQFSDGQCVISWLTRFHSVAIYPTVDELLAIHGHGGRTVVVWEVADENPSHAA